MTTLKPAVRSIATALFMLGVTSAAGAAPIQLIVTVTNLAPTNSVSFAPLRFGFGNGTFDSFNINQAPGAGIISIAEGGGGNDWFPAFAAADPTSVRGTVGGALVPGTTASNTFTVDSAINQFFTFGAMVLPSNDFFIGNDNPAAFRVLDGVGNLLIPSITQRASQIWDAGSELFDPAAAAFVGNNSLRTAQNGVVTFNFSELSGFNGLTTGAGYVFNSQLQSNTDIYRISFAATPVPVPEPSTYLMIFGGLGLVMAFRRRQAERA